MNIKEYYLDNPVKFCEKFIGTKLLPYQKVLLKMLPQKEKINSIRSERHKQIINVYDIPVQLVKKEDNKILKPLYLNCYGKVYFFTKDDNVVFMKDKELEKYNIEKLEEF